MNAQQRLDSLPSIIQNWVFNQRKYQLSGGEGRTTLPSGSVTFVHTICNYGEESVFGVFRI